MQYWKHVSLVFISTHIDTVIKFITASANEAKRSAANRLKIKSVRDLHSLLFYSPHALSASACKRIDTQFPLPITVTDPRENDFCLRKTRFATNALISISKSGPLVVQNSIMHNIIPEKRIGVRSFFLPGTSGSEILIRKRRL